MKKCTSCFKSFSLEMFHKNKGTLDGRGSQCKECDKNGKVSRGRERKKKLVDALGGCCSICGYSKSQNALHFHHVDKDKEEVVSRLLRHGFKKAEEESKKCIVLCANCHAEIHSTEDVPVVYGGNKNRSEIVHGTVAGYRKCSPNACLLCKKAWSEYYRNRMDSKRNPDVATL